MTGLAAPKLALEYRQDPKLAYSLFLTRPGRKTSWNTGCDSEPPSQPLCRFMVTLCILQVFYYFNSHNIVFAGH